MAERFWEKPLAELSDTQWEQLCDGCGRCCLKKLQDEDTDELLYTRVMCRYLEQDSGRCACYTERTRLVPDCLDVRAMDIAEAEWMPSTCAYRLRFEGKPLAAWHPLIAGSRRKMEEEGIALGGRAISEEYVHPDGLDEHVVRWVN